MRGLTWSGGRHAFPGGGGIGGPSGLAPYTADEFPTLPGEWRQLRDDLGLIDDDGDEEWLTDLGRRVAERLLPCPFCGAAG